MWPSTSPAASTQPLTWARTIWSFLPTRVTGWTSGCPAGCCGQHVTWAPPHRRTMVTTMPGARPLPRASTTWTLTYTTYIYYHGYDGYTKYCADHLFGIVDDLGILEPGDDAATANYGGRTPTREEWYELINKPSFSGPPETGSLDYGSPALTATLSFCPPPATIVIVRSSTLGASAPTGRVRSALTTRPTRGPGHHALDLPHPRVFCPRSA